MQVRCCQMYDNMEVPSILLKIFGRVEIDDSLPEY